MAPYLGRNRARDFENVVGEGNEELDPENDNYSAADDDVDDELEHSEQSDNQFDGREHYTAVGKSKLRRPQVVGLGPRYQGSKVDRDDLDEDDYSHENDPFGSAHSDTGSGEDGSAVDEDESLDDLDDNEEERDSNEDDLQSSQTDLSDDDATSLRPRQSQPKDSVKEALDKNLDRNAQRAITASISQANKDDVEKGRAVKSQRTAFDSLLGARMKLQKSLVATNTLVGLPQEHLNEGKDEAASALKAAETAAFNLWKTLNDFREELVAAKSGDKRKRSEFDIDTPVENLWRQLRAQEDDVRPTRDAVLLKWSNKSQGVVVQTDRSRLTQGVARSTIIDVLQEQLTDPKRLVKRAHTPRSCAPLQVSQRVDEDPRIYDDADFYSLLLKELLEQKSQDSATTASIDIGFQMRREARTKKVVDTKASKGRKLRYTVHEKLQNFMAPEDRGAWGQRQADEFFGSLFGQKLGLAEKEDEDDQMDDDIDPTDAALMMFRS